MLGKDAFRSLRHDIGERGLVERPRIHQPVLGEVFDDEVYEVKLVGVEAATGDEGCKGILGSAALETDEGADEGAKAFPLLPRPVEVCSAADPRFDEHPLELGEIASRQRVIATQLLERDVILVLAQDERAFSRKRSKSLPTSHSPRAISSTPPSSSVKSV